MKTTVLLHFYNEEYLLPDWLLHHRRLFDHGIMIDYHSTDRSVDIIRELVPHWKIVTSRNEMFDVVEVDKEVMEYEEQLDGWKCALNITEFFFVWDLAELLKSFEQRNLRSLWVPFLTLADPVEQSFLEEDYSIPFVLRHTQGLDRGFEGYKGSGRCIHAHPTGRYHLGRHSTDLENMERVDDAFILWTVAAPFNRHIIKRKRQIDQRVPKSNRERNYSWQHVRSEWSILKEYVELSHDVYPLVERHPVYANILEQYKRNYEINSTPWEHLRT